MKKIMKNKNKGFTIVELIVVMAIIAILILIAVPTFTKYIDNANKTAEMANADTIFKSAMSAVVEDYTQPTRARVPIGAIANTVSSPNTLVQDIEDGVDGTVSMRVYGYRVAPTERSDKTSAEWEVYIESSGGTSPVANATGDIYVIAPDGTIYLNGDAK